MNAVDVIRADNATVLNLPGAWVGGSVPGASDVAVWDSTVTASRSSAIGGNLFWSGIRIGNTGGTLMTIGTTASSVLDLGSAGIDMSAANADLTLSAVTNFSASQSWSIASGRTLQLNPTTSNTGSASISIAGPGNLMLANGTAHIGTGTVTLGGGVRITSNGGTGRTINNNLVLNGDIGIGSTSATPLNGQITLSGSSIDLGNATRTISLQNSVTDSSVVTMVIGSSANTVSVTNGTLALVNGNGSGTVRVTLGVSGSSFTPVISSNLNVGANVVAVLPQSNVLSTSTDLTVDGRLRLGNLSSASSSNAVKSLSGSGAIDSGQASGTNIGTLVINGGASTGTTTFSGVIENGAFGSVAITKLGANTQIFSGANTYTGTTTMGAANGSDGGILRLSGSGKISNAATTVFAGTLDLNGINQSVTTLTLGGGASGTTAAVTTGAGTLTLGGNVTYTATNNPNGATISGKLDLGGVTRTFTVGDSTAAATDLAVSADISATGAFGVTKAGTGTMSLSGTNSYTGATLVNAGILKFGSIGALGGSGRTFTITSPGVAVLQGATDISSLLARIVTTSTGTVALDTNSSTAIDLTGLTALSLGAIGNVTYSGALTPTSGKYILGGGGGNLTVTSTLSTAATMTVNGLSGTGRVILAPSADNTYNGATTLVGGAILQGSDSTAYSGDANVRKVFGTGVIAPSTNATTVLELRANGQNDSSAQTLTYGNTVQGSTGLQNFTVDVNRQGGTGSGKTLALGTLNFAINATGPATINMTGGNGYLLKFSSGIMGGGAATGSLILNPTSTSVTIAGGVTNVAAGASVKTLVLDGTSTGNSITGALSEGTTGAQSALTKSNSSTWILTGANTYTGATTVTSGTLIVSGAGTINSTSGISVNGGTFNYQNNSTGLNRNVTVNGGTFKNNSTQNYTGALTFTSGTVGGTNLSGVALSIGSGQTISPGNSPGTLTTGAETWTGGGSYVWEINDATGAQGTNWDFISGSGVLDISSLSSGSQFNINVVGLNGSNVSGAVANWNGAVSQSWKIATFSSFTGTFAANLFNVDTTGFTNNNTAPGAFTVTYSGTGGDLFLAYTAVPEPATWALLAFSLTTVMVLRRRRRE